MNNTILIDGIRYHKDRPASCRQCYFWKNRKVGCTLGKENCYYLAESTKKKSPCEGCCYGPPDEHGLYFQNKISHNTVPLIEYVSII